MENYKIMVPKSGYLTFEEFKEKISLPADSESLVDKVSNLYEKLPGYIRSIQNLDPTGIAGAIDQTLSDNKAKRERENLMCALYNFYKAIMYLGNRHAELDSTIKQHCADLTYLYFEKSRESYDVRKIDYFKNIWINGMLSNEETLDEKAYVFSIVSSLSIDELKVLFLLAEKQAQQDFRGREPLSVNDVGEQIGLSISRSQQLCIGLSGKGLLHDHGLGKYGYKEPIRFVITDYVKLISKYLREP